MDILGLKIIMEVLLEYVISLHTPRTSTNISPKKKYFTPGVTVVLGVGDTVNNTVRDQQRLEFIGTTILLWEC